MTRSFSNPPWEKDFALKTSAIPPTAILSIRKYRPKDMGWKGVKGTPRQVRIVLQYYLESTKKVYGPLQDYFI